MVALTLLRLRQALSYRLLSWIFGVSISSVKRYIDNILPLLHDVLSPLVFIPDYNERKKYHYTLNDGYTYAMIIDGMEHCIYSCSDDLIRHSTFSAKKSSHTFTQLIGVNKEGQIWYISKSYPGSVSDFNLSEFPENQIYKKLTPQEKIAGDQGFRGLEDVSIYTHISSPKDKDERRFNSEFKHYRSVVENSISQIRKWKICSHKFSSKIKNLEEAMAQHTFLLQIIAGLVNLFVMPIRKYEMT